MCFFIFAKKIIRSLHPSFPRKSCFQATVPGPTVQAANIDQYNSDLWESGDLHHGGPLWGRKIGSTKLEYS